MGRNRGILHQSHGLLTSSQHSIDDAAFWFIALERACQQQLAGRGDWDQAAVALRQDGGLQPRACRQRLHRLAALPDAVRPHRGDPARHVRLNQACLARRFRP
ncbi:hypothetical protein [Dankookia sp. P2]|uniref:hypothetical protein n=1 Tax=Dankookia sp. P2 TaxID=3423955 RepID=UPI003D6777C2